MAASSTRGPKGQPRFPANEAPDLGVDEEIVADYAAKVGNRRVGTTAERDLAESSGDVWEGLLWGDITDKHEYEHVGGVWKQLLAHAEYTLTVTSLPDDTLFTNFNFAADAERTTDSTFSSIYSSRLRLEPGIYSVAVVGKLSTVANGRCAFLLSAGSEELARTTVMAVENVLNASIPNYFVSATTDVTIGLIKSTGGTADFAARLRVTRIFTV